MDLMPMYDYSHDVEQLVFYSEYNFSLVAVYNLTGTPVRSDSVLVSHTTEQGGK